MVTVSNGHGKFHMIYAAQAAQEAGLLDLLLTGAYPSAGVKLWLKPLARATGSGSLRRWLMREAPGVPDNKVVSCFKSEVLNQLAVRFPRYGWNGSSRVKFDTLALKAYRSTALRFIKESKAQVYHCRSGYAGKTADLAKRRGMTVIIDHSIAHPHALVQLVENDGTYAAGERQSLPSFWRLVEEDLGIGDLILVNSDFVKKTLVDYAVEPERIVVMYWGLDAETEGSLRSENARHRANNGPIKFLFAGGVGKRKGADKVLEVFERLVLTGWDLTLAGGVEPELKKKVQKISNPRIHVLARC